MTSVHCGTNFLKKRVTKCPPAFLRIVPRFSVRFAIFTLPYIKAPMPPPLRSLLPPTIPTRFCSIHHRIHFATLIIIDPRSLPFPLPIPALPPPYLEIHPIPHTNYLHLAAELLYDWSRKQTPLQDRLGLTRRQPVISERALGPPLPLNLPH